METKTCSTFTKPRYSSQSPEGRRSLKDGPGNVSESRARKWGSRCRGDDDNRELSQSFRSRPLRQQIFGLQPTPNPVTFT